MAKDMTEAPPEDLFSNPDQATGFSDDNDWVKYWNPEKNDYQTLNLKGLTGTQKRDVINKLDLGHYQNDQGEFVYGARPEVLAHDPTGQYMMQGYVPPDPKWDTGGLTLGGNTPADQSGGTGDPGTGMPTPIDPGTSQPPNQQVMPPTGPGTQPPLPTEQPPIPDESGGAPPPPGQPPSVGVGSPNAPYTGTPGEGGGYNFNWGDAAPGAPSMVGGGGYDPGDYAFERYVPGQESPWGVPDVEGGNKDFYRNQFMNLLNQEQNFQGAQRGAAEVREEAAANPMAPAGDPWSWLEGGLPEVQVSQGLGTGPDGGGGYSLAEGLSRPMTNRAIMQNLAGKGILSGEDTAHLNKWWEESMAADPENKGGESVFWGSHQSPQEFLSKMGGDPQGGHLDILTKIANSMFTNNATTTGAGSGVPAGYAMLPGA